MEPQQQNNQNQPNQGSESDMSISFQQEQFNRIYTNELKKKQLSKQKQGKKQTTVVKVDKSDINNILEIQDNSRQQRKEKEGMEVEEDDRQQRQMGKEDLDRPVNWHVYDYCQSLTIDTSRFNSYILHLPIYKKKQQILNNIINNQILLVTGQTGCGKSTQVPRLLYQYIRETKMQAKIICVQPRRLAVKNLHKILSDQIPEKGAVGYHIAMQTFIRENTKILFMTNGIFLQRLVHGTEFFQQYPFIVLDQVHQRDIDTDFILLSMKRLMRNHPKIRVILMSATIDNKLFQYYFAEDQVDHFMERENFYKRFIRLEASANKQRRQQQEQDDGYRIQRVGQQDDLYKQIQMQYLSAKYPCPTVNVTQKGKFKKQYYYLDTLKNFIRRPYCMKWGSIGFIEKQPSTNRQLYETACVILEEIMMNAPKDRSNQSILVFLPGLGEIEFMASEMRTFFGDRIQNFQIVKCHSSILNDETTKKLHQMYKTKFKIIIATNIAESSITVFGIKYIIDFCLSKEINFNQKSRMENLELVWASKASCQQRAGRTGRVCDGIVFRMVQQTFYKKLADYSTPQIQRSSLDKLILRIKLIHQNQKSAKIFQDPGEVLGTAIQPPNLKHIDEAIKSLILCGGLKVEDDKLLLTKLGRIYVDIPLDIIYSKMLVFSMLMGTYDDILILVCILSQSKNAFRKSHIEKNPLQYFQMMTNEERCDFVALINAYRQRKEAYSKNHRDRPPIQLDIFYETNLLIEDVSRRIKQRKIAKKIYPDQNHEEYEQKFKITLAFGFLTQLMKVRPMIYDDKQQKRYKLMKKQGISVRNTVILLNSDSIRKSPDQNQGADNRMRQNWIHNISSCFRIRPQTISLTLGHGLSFIHFKQQTDLSKFLFIKYIEKKRTQQQKPSNSRSLTLSQVLSHIGDIDYMQQGSPCQLLKQQRVQIDNYSSNRIIPVPIQSQSINFPTNRLLLTNSITQHNSRLSCRYASLLPDIANLDSILYMVFYPFVVLMPDRKRTKYDSLYLKRKSRIFIGYQLDDQEVYKANQIRGILRELMDLSLGLEEEEIQPVVVTEDGRIVEDQQQVNLNEELNNEIIVPTIPFQMNSPSPAKNTQQIKLQNIPKKQQSQASLRNEQRLQKMRKFWPSLKSFLTLPRSPVLQQQKYQQLYLKQHKITSSTPHVKQNLEQPTSYFSQIKTFPLLSSLFTSSSPHLVTYSTWKQSKYRQLQQMHALATDHDPYIVCATCGIKVAKLGKLGPINNQYFRELFQYEDGNLIKLVYSEIGDYFCSMLMTVYIQKEYDVWGCKNGHYLAVKMKDQKKFKILAFSQISILYPDGSLDQQPQFQALQYRKWRERAEQSKIQKMKKPAPITSCFVCGDKFRTIKDIQLHVKNPYHESNFKDFQATISKPNNSEAKNHTLKQKDKNNDVIIY